MGYEYPTGQQACQSAGGARGERATLIRAASTCIILGATAGVTGCFSQPTEESNVQSSPNISTKSFSSCVVSRHEVERLVQMHPQDKRRYEEYVSAFDFNDKRHCYEQHWTIPTQVSYLVTKGGAGAELVRLNFPPAKQGEHAAGGYGEDLNGLAVVASPVAPSLTFADANRFRRKNYPERTDQDFKHYEVWEYKPGHIHRALIDPKGSELYALILLDDGSQLVSEDNARRIGIKSNLDDKYELSYVLPVRKLDQIHEVNERVTNTIRTHLDSRKGAPNGAEN